MDFELRRFENTDFNELVSVWNAHHADLGTENAVGGLQIELSCFSKPYFDESDCVVAVAQGQVVAFGVLGQCADFDLDDLDPSTAYIAALCIQPSASEHDIAAALIARMEEVSLSRNANAISFRPSFPSVGLFLGLGPGGSMIGLTTHEARVTKWLADAGFNVVEEFSLWELDLAGFRGPVDREQMKIRRTARVNRDVDEPMLPWWQACVLGHTDPCSLQLSMRAEKTVVGDVLFWTVAPELKTGNQSKVWLWPPQIDPEKSANLLFLLAESYREFSEEGLDIAVATSAAHQTQLNDVYRRLGFTCVSNGALYEKALSTG